MGAGVGLLGGAAAGVGRGEGSSEAVQARYDMTYMQCMYAKGNQIPVARGSEPAYTSPPPPPPTSGRSAPAGHPAATGGSTAATAAWIMTLLPGKLPPALLRRLLRFRGARDRRVVVGPALRLDAAVVDLGPQYLILKSDPVTFTAEEVGWYAVHVNANDVADMGARPAGSSPRSSCRRAPPPRW